MAKIKDYQQYIGMLIWDPCFPLKKAQKIRRDKWLKPGIHLTHHDVSPPGIANVPFHY